MLIALVGLVGVLVRFHTPNTVALPGQCSGGPKFVDASERVELWIAARGAGTHGRTSYYHAGQYPQGALDSVYLKTSEVGRDSVSILTIRSRSGAISCWSPIVSLPSDTLHVNAFDLDGDGNPSLVDASLFSVGYGTSFRLQDISAFLAWMRSAAMTLIPAASYPPRAAPF